MSICGNDVACFTRATWPYGPVYTFRFARCAAKAIIACSARFSPSGFPFTPANQSAIIRAMKIALVAFALALFASTVVAQETSMVERKIIKLPHATMPREAKESGLGGRVRVLVAVDPMGNVIAVENVVGPDSVCSSVNRSDVLALRDAARTAAMDARFEPAKRNDQAIRASAWLSFDFPKEPVGQSDSPADKDSSGNSINQSKGGPPRLVNGPVPHENPYPPSKPVYPPAALAVRASGNQPP